MQTTITARHCEISEALRERALAVMERLGELAHRPVESTVVFDRDGLQATAELRLHASRGELLVARGEGDDHRTALDRAEERLRRQLDKVAPPLAPLARRRAQDRLMLRLRDFVSRRGEPLQLEALTGELGLDRQMPEAEVASPGLALAGYTGRFAAQPDPRLRRDRDHLPQLALPRRAPGDAEQVLRLRPALHLRHQGRRRCRRRCSSWPAARSVPVLRSKLKTAEFYRRIKPVVEEAFAPRTTLHGSLADVYGVGLLFIGRSGIGKSECVLDLVERGHRLVADDVVQVTRRGNDVLIGRGHELAAHHMEIRGIGLIDIPALFGVRAVRQQKRIEVVVQLEDWETAKDTDRTGLARAGDHDSRRRACRAWWCRSTRARTSR